MTNWKEYKLSDLMQIKYGKDHKHLADGTYPLYGSGGIMRYVEKPLYQEESILIPRKGTLSNLFYLNEPFWSVDTMFYSQINKELVLPKYLFYTLKTFDLASLNVGSAVPSLTTQVLNEVLVSVPDIETQTAIAEILSSLDDKIELNNKINQELENLAQTLFKQWFIDFEFPNENGEPYKSSGGEMVDSELGEIPKGWEVGNLNQIAELLKKNKKPFENPDRIYHHYSLPEFDAGKMPSTELGEKILSSKYQVLEHSILVSKLNPRIPRIWTIIKPNDNSICSTEFQVLKPLDDVFFPFVNCLCSSDGYINSIQSKVTGTSSSHQRVNPKDIINYEMVLPPLSIVNQFYISVYDSLNLIDDNRKENQELTNLRDTLLPKLISGELEVNGLNLDSLDLLDEKDFKKKADNNQGNQDNLNNQGSDK
ncbi:MAG: restriction endonuclease subunit S [Chitinophagales bacterium]|nr:restriction endonuclease subunit S [Chitinophagales bacterium]